MRADGAADILIAGGGPAGVALALRLRRLGYDVLLAAPWSPRARSAHDFETLSPASEKLLGLLELSSALDRAGLGRFASEISWSSAAFEARPSPVASFLIDRRAFHADLLALAAAAGFRVCDARISALEAIDRGWRVKGVSRGNAFEATIPRVADASGRRGLVRTDRRRGPPVVAIHAIWSGRALPSALRVAAGPEGWVWGAPVGAGRYLTTVFQDPRHSREGRDRLTERVSRAVCESAVLDGAADLTLEGVSGVSDATPYVGTCYDKRGLFRLGDAALALDPLSSSGVQAALQSAIDVALAIHTLHLDPGASELTETFLSRRLERRLKRHATWTASFYREAARRFPHPFWLERAATGGDAETKTTLPASLPPPDQPVALDPAVRMAPEACAVGDSIAWRMAVDHPTLTEPVAFLNGIELSGLLTCIAPGSSATRVVEDWSPRVGQEMAIAIFSWAWRTGLIRPLCS
jgi:flavin-dependent dehydrogenase